MILFRFSTWLALAVNGVLGVLVFAINPRRPANVHYLALTLTVSGWLICLTAGSYATDRDAVVFWMQQASIWPLRGASAIGSKSGNGC